MLEEHLLQHAGRVLEKAQKAGVRIATAESCTGGLLAACLTEIPGASAVFERGFITYSNAAKTELLGVPASLLDEFGAVSEEVARAMAEGALEHSDARLAIAITGVAGPTGGSPEKPVGLVCFGLAQKDKDNGHIRLDSEPRLFGAIGRAQVRQHATETALGLLHTALQANRDGPESGA